MTVENPDTPNRQALRDTHERLLVEITQRLIKAKLHAIDRIDADLVETLNGILETVNAAHKSSRDVERTDRITDRELHRRCVDTHIARIDTLTDDIEHELVVWDREDEDWHDALVLNTAIWNAATKVGYR